MKRTRALRTLSPLLAIAAMGSAQIAQAQQACLALADVDDTATYAMPIAYDAAMAACGAQYSSDGFMKTKGIAFADQFRSKQDESWPGAFRLIKTFMPQSEANTANGKSDAMMEMLSAMPEEALRPFFDGLVTQMISSEIKPDTCAKIERGMALISPLPPENVSGLVAFVLEMAEMESPAICGVPAAGDDGSLSEEHNEASQ